MKVYDGVAVIACDAVILPVYRRCAIYAFLYMRGKFRIRWFPKITLTISAPFTCLSRKGKKKREYLAQVVFDTMTNMVCEGRNSIKIYLSAYLKPVNFMVTGMFLEVCSDSPQPIIRLLLSH